MGYFLTPEGAVKVSDSTVNVRRRNVMLIYVGQDDSRAVQKVRYDLTATQLGLGNLPKQDQGAAVDRLGDALTAWFNDPANNGGGVMETPKRFGVGGNEPGLQIEILYDTIPGKVAS